MKRVVTILALVALAASFSFADGHITIDTDGGTWQWNPPCLEQTDPDAWLAGAMAPVGLPGKAEYSFDVSYIDGIQDNAAGIGAIVDDRVMGLVWDPARGGSGLWAEIWDASGMLYSQEVPSSIVNTILTIIERVGLANVVLPVRIRLEPSTGNVWAKDPFDATTWWAFNLGRPVSSNIVGVGTSSVAAKFCNFDANPMS